MKTALLHTLPTAFTRPIFLSVFALLATSLSATTARAQYPSTVLADNPIGFWRLNETSGTTALDSSGNGRNGTYVNGVTLGDATAIPAGGPTAHFNGTNQYVSLPGSWGGGSTYTLEAWARVSATSSDFEALLSATDLRFFHFQLYGAGNNVFYPTSGGVANLSIISQTPLDTWRHFVFVASPGASQLYVDGVAFGPLNTTAYTTISATSDLRIGAGYQGGRFFNGNIQNVAIYQTALSADRIQTHYTAGISGSGTAAAPEPSALALVLAATIPLLDTLRRRKAR